MNSGEKEYYEKDSFWNPKNVKEDDIQRIKDTYKLIPQDVDSLVDVGCGNGIFINYIQTKNKKIKLLGVDNSKTALKYVKTEIQKGNITNIPVKDKSFDLVSALEIIEHLSYEEYELGLKELARISKKYILISVPYKEKLENNFIKCPVCKTQFSASYHKNTFDETKMTKLLKKYGFNCSYMGYLGKKREYVIITSLYRFLRRKVFKSNRVFLCPACGFFNSKSQNKSDTNSKKGLKKYILLLFNILWPKYTTYRWIVGLYKRGNKIN